MDGRQIDQTVAAYGKPFCRYETRPTGCLNPTCRFQHRKPRHLQPMGGGRQIDRTVSSYGKTFCRYERRPTGCLNPRCRFRHRKPKHLPDTHLPRSNDPDKACHQVRRSHQLFKTRRFQKRGGVSTSSQPRGGVTTHPTRKETSTPTAHKRQSLPSSSLEESMGEGPRTCKRRRTQQVRHVPDTMLESGTNSSSAKKRSSSSLDCTGLIQALMSLSLSVADSACS